jgi:hypothetical protein
MDKRGSSWHSCCPALDSVPQHQQINILRGIRVVPLAKIEHLAISLRQQSDIVANNGPVHWCNHHRHPPISAAAVAKPSPYIVSRIEPRSLGSVEIFRSISSGESMENAMNAKIGYRLAADVHEIVIGLVS